MKNDLMLIGEIADFFGISRKAIRLYEKKGIIRPVKVDPANGYRYYSGEQVHLVNIPILFMFASSCHSAI